jgi:nitroreductase
MELFEAIKGRRSCRNFTGAAIEDDKLQRILEAGGWAPSVMNLQPWRFYVIKNPSMKIRLKESCEATAQEIFQRSGWKWVSKYSFEFLVQAPVIIAVTASPKETGADQFLPEGVRDTPSPAVRLYRTCSWLHILLVSPLYGSRFMTLQR